MRLTTPLFVIANVLLTAHANDVQWRLPLEAGANAAHAVAARSAAARAVESLGNNLATHEDHREALSSYPAPHGLNDAVKDKPLRKTHKSLIRNVKCSKRLIADCEAEVNELDAIGWLSYEQAKMWACSSEDCATCSPLCGQQGGSAYASG